MKQRQLQELVQLITRSVLKEYSMLSTASSSDKTKVEDPQTDSDPTTDIMTPAEKARAEREASITKQKELKSTVDAQKSAKRESEMYKQKAGEYDRYKKKELQGKIDTLKKEI